MSDEQAFNEAATDRPTATPFDPQRILRECEAKRTVVGVYRKAIRRAQGNPDSPAGVVEALELVLKCLAPPYADHADYRPEWVVTEIPGDE